jgi:MoaA/NifB/PqqE/SkfB family radical SAM enzyme
MSALMQEMSDRALRLGVPFSAQLDLTYRCNEQCVHCYLDHDDHGEMSTVEIKHLLSEMAEAGVFILTLSGGEIFMRKDFFEILEHARALTFCIKLKTNAVLVREKQAARLRELGVESIQVSIYSHRAEVHDAITKVPGSLRRSVDAIRFLRSQGLKVVIANVLMTENMQDHHGVRALAEELGARYTLDPTITPMMDGDRSILDLNAGESALWATPMSSVRRRPRQRKTAWIRCLAARVTLPATFLPTASFIPACSFRCLVATSGDSGSSISGATLSS